MHVLGFLNGFLGEPKALLESLFHAFLAVNISFPVAVDAVGWGGARGVSAGDADEGAAGRGLVATEWSHAYVAMGLRLSHQSQTALLARVYNLDSAVSFVVAIAEDLGYRVRQGAISASDDDAGRQLRE